LSAAEKESKSNIKIMNPLLYISFIALLSALTVRWHFYSWRARRVLDASSHGLFYLGMSFFKSRMFKIGIVVAGVVGVAAGALQRPFNLSSSLAFIRSLRTALRLISLHAHKYL